jgi:hypothetical protein
MIKIYDHKKAIEKRLQKKELLENVLLTIVFIVCVIISGLMPMM